jgi:hypothetical protein
MTIYRQRLILGNGLTETFYTVEREREAAVVTKGEKEVGILQPRQPFSSLFRLWYYVMHIWLMVSDDALWLLLLST